MWRLWQLSWDAILGVSLLLTRTPIGCSTQFDGGLGCYRREVLGRGLPCGRDNTSPKGGRLTLLCSTLSSLPIYYMSLLWLPGRVKMRLEGIQRDFLWGRDSLDKKPHMVKWATVCSDKRERGLGVRCFYKLNRDLLSKWLWCFANERDSL